jgi:hypothetical protein
MEAGPLPVSSSSWRPPGMGNLKILQFAVYYAQYVCDRFRDNVKISKELLQAAKNNLSRFKIIGLI